MKLEKIVELGKRAFNTAKSNIDYIAAEGNALLFSYVSAISASWYVQYQNLGKLEDAILTYVAKACTYMAINLITFAAVKASEKDLKNLARSNLETIIPHALVTIPTHYASIKMGWIPREFAALVIYPTIGSATLGIKQFLNYKKGVWGRRSPEMDL